MSRRRQANAAAGAPGVEVRHQQACPANAGQLCDCEPGYRAWVLTRDRKKIQKTFKTLEEAVNWREEARVDLRRGVMAPRAGSTVREVAARWLAGARAGGIRNRSGEIYKPSVIRSYDANLRDYVLPEFGESRLTELRRSDVQRLVDDLVGIGLSASTVRNAIMPLRAICRRALARGEIHVNPTLGLEVPAQRGRRDRIASPEEAAALIAALPPRDRPLWATAMYGGLRRGELRALRWGDIDLKRGVIHVRRSWDPVEGVIDPKSRAGKRTVPIAAVLREELVAYGDPEDVKSLAFGRTRTETFDPSTVSDRAGRAWRAAGLEPITLHECRHTVASLMIAAGANPKALQTYMGHASITVTLDLYGHLMPGSEEEVVALLDVYLARHRGRPPAVGQQLVLGRGLGSALWSRNIRGRMSARTGGGLSTPSRNRCAIRTSLLSRCSSGRESCGRGGATRVRDVPAKPPDRCWAYGGSRAGSPRRIESVRQALTQLSALS